MTSKTDNVDVLTEASLKKMKVTELREKLAEESLDTKGVKDDLVKRLLEHFESKKEEGTGTGKGGNAPKEAAAGEQAPTATVATGPADGADGADAAGGIHGAPRTKEMTEAEKSKARAQRFGIPEKKQPQGKSEKEAKEQPKKKVGIGGLGDIDRKEEFERRKKRAERFGMPVPIDTEEELEKKKQRAERFGLPAPPPSALEVAAKLKAREERFGKQ